jgi:nitroreductase
MGFLELASKRQSVRKYQEKPVEREKMERCIEAARLAPSACNSQPWKFIIVDEPELKDKLSKETFGKLISFNHFSIQAPVLAVVVDEGTNLTAGIGGIVKNKQYNLFDVGIAAEHFCLQAAEEGLGTCMLGWFDEKRVKELLKIPSSKRVGLIITVGYPETDNVRPKSRKTIEDIKSYNKY